VSFFVKKSSVCLVVGLWLITCIGIRSVPLEKHEVFVLETSQQMQTSGDWVLPHFNHSVRLQKPPFSYWATVLVSALDPLHSDIQVEHGRLVSLLGALWMGLIVLRAGTMLYGEKTGLLAALFLMGMQGFIHMSHNARPDLLYASFCTLQLFSWAEAWRAEDRSRQQCLGSLLGWGAAALATLTKGPQMPFVFLFGLLIFLLSGKERSRLFQIIKPLRGVGLFCLIVLPWWFLLQKRLQLLGVDISESQMSGSLLHNLASWKEMLSGYYPWTLLGQMLPVSLILPFVSSKVWKNRHENSAATRLLLTVGLTMFVAFTLGGHYRKHYLLPLLPICALFIARSVTGFVFPAIQKKGRAVILSLLGVALLGCVGLLVAREAYVTLVLLFLVGGLLFIALRIEKRTGDWKSSPFAAQMLFFSLLTTTCIAGYNAMLPFDRIRIAEETLAVQVQQIIQPNDLLLEWKSSTVVLPYYTKREVFSFRVPENLREFIALNSVSSGSVFVVLPTSEVEEFQKRFDIQVLEKTRVDSRHPKKALTFVRILNEL